MKFIIVIKGVLIEKYEDIRKDIIAQCKLADYPIPIFAYLPADEPAIEIVWTDAEMELKHLEMIGKQAMIGR